MHRLVARRKGEEAPLKPMERFVSSHAGWVLSNLIRYGHHEDRDGLLHASGRAIETQRTFGTCSIPAMGMTALVDRSEWRPFANTRGRTLAMLFWGDRSALVGEARFSWSGETSVHGPEYWRLVPRVFQIPAEFSIARGGDAAANAQADAGQEEPHGSVDHDGAEDAPSTFRIILREHLRPDTHLALCARDEYHVGHDLHEPALDPAVAAWRAALFDQVESLVALGADAPGCDHAWSKPLGVVEPGLDEAVAAVLAAIDGVGLWIEDSPIYTWRVTSDASLSFLSADNAGTHGRLERFETSGGAWTINGKAVHEPHREWWARASRRLRVAIGFARPRQGPTYSAWTCEETFGERKIERRPLTIARATGAPATAHERLRAAAHPAFSEARRLMRVETAS